jgi:DNA topoisomerase IA
MNKTKISNAHPQICPIDFKQTSDEISATLSNRHSDIYHLIWSNINIRLAGHTIIERRSLSLPIRNNNYTLQIYTNNFVEKGWLHKHIQESNYPIDINGINYLSSLTNIGNNALDVILYHPDDFVIENTEIEQLDAQPHRKKIEVTTLLDKMRDLGIGKPSTYAAAIHKLLDKDGRNYIFYQKSDFVPQLM